MSDTAPAPGPAMEPATTAPAVGPPAPPVSGPAPFRPRWLWPRPAEWVTLAFLAYLLAWTAFSSQTRVVFELSSNADFIVTILLVAAARLGKEYWTLKWQHPGSRLARIYPTSALLFLGPVAWVVVTEILEYRAPVGFDQGGRAAAVLYASFYAIRHELAVAVPAVFLWLALGVHAKRHGRFRLGALVREDLFRAADTARDFLPVALLLFAYSTMGDVLDQRIIADKDWLMARIDRWLFLGHDPVQALQAIISTPLSEWLAFSYCAYVVWYPLCLAVLYAQHDRTGFRELAFAITLGLAVGYATFTFVPVQGPVFTQQFSVSLDYYYVGEVKAGLMDRLRIYRDCFPSLHTAITMLFLWSAWRWVRRFFWVILPMCASTPFACVYLRYHYVVDVLAGFALAAFVAWLTPRVISGWQRRQAGPWVR